MTKAVLDASAVLAALYREPGGDAAIAVAPEAAISAVNFAEIVSKLIAKGLNEADAIATARGFDIDIAPVDARQAELAGLLHAKSRRQGISLGDAFCLALATLLGTPALTADRRWVSLNLDVAVVLIR
jgi:PIN domain nuclease of toxin-antitoxin system